jgi:hypothetical protein
MPAQAKLIWNKSIVCAKKYLAGNALPAAEVMHKTGSATDNMVTLCRTTAGSVLYSYGEANAREDVWMSHGDSVVQLPPGFSVVAKSDQVTESACRDAVWDSCCTRNMAASNWLAGVHHHPCIAVVMHHSAAVSNEGADSVLTEAMLPAWCCQNAAIAESYLQRCLCWNASV